MKPKIQPSWIRRSVGDEIDNDIAVVDAMNCLFNDMTSIFGILELVDDTDKVIEAHYISGLGYMLEGMVGEGKELINQWHQQRGNVTSIKDGDQS